MFVRQKKNKSGSVSVQIISKSSGKYKVVKTIGSSHDPQKVNSLVDQARFEISRQQRQGSLWISQESSVVEGFLSTLSNSQVRVIGPELVFGRVYDHIGYGDIQETLFRHLVVCRLVYPGSKSQTVDYLYRYRGIDISVDSIYRFLDKLRDGLKEEVEQITFNHKKKILGQHIGLVFYDMTTLHFEASREDDFRKRGYSKTGKHQLPQIYIGLLVGANGYPIGYEAFEGNIYEGHTLIPILQHFEAKFSLSKPIVVADAGLLSKANLTELQSHGYKYILGARIKNESMAVRRQILNMQLSDKEHAIIKKDKSQRLIIHYSDQRAKQDAYNRQRGLNRLEKKLNAGRLTKSHINNRGYNKYLIMKGKVDIEIDYDKFTQDQQWDGLKGYITNSRLGPQKIIDNYRHLFHIERAFRISKSDLKIRPVYHRLKDRIDAHLCIAFSAYAVYKELERVLALDKSNISATRAGELTQNMYELDVVLPDTGEPKRILLQMTAEQAALHNTVIKYF